MMQLHRLVGPDDFTLLLNMVHMGVLAFECFPVAGAQVPAPVALGPDYLPPTPLPSQRAPRRPGPEL